MGSRISRTRRLGLTTLVILLMAMAAGACTSQRPDNQLLVWTSLGGEIELKAQNRIIAAFEKDNPGVKVQLVPKSGQFTGDATALIAAVRGKTPPNVYIIDRFTTAQQASVGLFENLQPRVDADGENLTDKYLPFAAGEASYNGDLYALPFDTDARGLLYNKTVLRDAGVDPAVLDPSNGPPTIDELLEIGKKIDQKDKRGNYTRMGIIPWDGQAFHATWALINHAEWFDDKTCEVTFTSPGWEKSMNDFATWSKELGYRRVQTFLATYRPPNQPPQQSPFYTGKIGMAIDGNWSLQSIRDYAPKLDYGVTYLPVPKEGDPPMSWAGGFALTMPKGAPNQELTWKFMKFMAGEQGQRLYIEGQSKLPTWKSLLDDQELTKNQGIFPSMLKDTLSRPALPVGAQVSDAMDAAQSGVLLGEITPDEALQQVQNRVGPQMKQFCPFTLSEPKG
ncbi:ABC transporter substrate-binding protein [Actinopolymorpha alba]|uniref:ABC transporter substrate-binding protein n=1 Tax=Actinopolymorpha alba TaxID=533267 RepID=UPI000380CAEE|nr:ABC transporter substrate-binding protein [Actinopolymorpha alba]